MTQTQSGTDEQHKRAVDGTRTLTGERLDTYLKTIGEQVKYTAVGAGTDTARFAHEMFGKLIEQERTFLQEQHRASGAEPSLAFSGNGLPHMESLQADAQKHSVEMMRDDAVSEPSAIHKIINEDLLLEKLRRDRIDRRETTLRLGRGANGSLEVRVADCAYRDCIDDIGQRTPFYLRTASTEYQIAFGELFWTQQTQCYIAEPKKAASPTTPVIDPNKLKKYDDLRTYYPLENRHLTTPRRGIMRRHTIPGERLTVFTHTHEARATMTLRILNTLQQEFWHISDKESLLNSSLKGLMTALQKEVYGQQTHTTEFWFGTPPVQLASVTQIGNYNEDRYGGVRLVIDGHHIRDDAHRKHLQKIFEKKRIIP